MGTTLGNAPTSGRWLTGAATALNDATTLTASVKRRLDLDVVAHHAGPCGRAAYILRFLAQIKPAAHDERAATASRRALIMPPTRGARRRCHVLPMRKSEYLAGRLAFDD